MKRRLLHWLLRRTGTYAAGLILSIDSRFQSANSVPVERAVIKRQEWESLRALLMFAAMERKG